MDVLGYMLVLFIVFVRVHCFEMFANFKTCVILQICFQMFTIMLHNVSELYEMLDELFLNMLHAFHFKIC